MTKDLTSKWICQLIKPINSCELINLNFLFFLPKVQFVEYRQNWKGASTNVGGSMLSNCSDYVVCCSYLWL